MFEKLTDGTARDLQTLQIKLTYVGSQLKARPSVAFTTFYHLLRMEWFTPLRSAGLNYGNDDGEVWNFTVSPDEMARVVGKLAQAAGIHTPAESSPQFSLMFALKGSRLGDAGGEVHLNDAQGEEVRRAMIEAFNADNGVARAVIELHGESFKG